MPLLPGRPASTGGKKGKGGKRKGGSKSSKK